MELCEWIIRMIRYSRLAVRFRNLDDNFITVRMVDFVRFDLQPGSGDHFNRLANRIQGEPDVFREADPLGLFGRGRFL